MSQSKAAVKKQQQIDSIVETKIAMHYSNLNVEQLLAVVAKLERKVLDQKQAAKIDAMYEMIVDDAT